MALQTELAMVLEMTRVRAELSQEYLAKKCGCSQAMIALVEKGERLPTLPMLRVWAKETGQAKLIGMVSEQFVDEDDDTQGLVAIIEENVRLRLATQILQGA